MSYEDALVMAIKAHDGQKRIQGGPYVVHPVRVAGRIGDAMRGSYTPEYIEMYKTVAVLHDVLEDTDVPSVDIEKAFGSRVSRAVELLSRPPKELRTKTYAQWIDDLIETGNAIAIRVKWADVQDNLADVDSLPGGKAGLRERYEKALKKLTAAIGVEG